VILLAIHEQRLGPDHPQTAQCLNNLAFLLRDQGDLTAARPLFERSLAIFERTLGSDHRNTNRARCNLARVLVEADCAEEALRLGEAALAAHASALGEGHAWTKDSAAVTADALDAFDALGRADDAMAVRARLGLGHAGG
jgi:tetratricopeptide (TPR) repeat protein